MGKIVGIDLGTTNSVVAVMQGGEPVVIPSAEGERLVPSVVAVNKNHERLVGRSARNQAIVNPENTVFSMPPIGLPDAMTLCLMSVSGKTGRRHSSLEILTPRFNPVWGSACSSIRPNGFRTRKSS